MTSSASQLIKSNIGAIGAGIGGVALGAGVVYAATRRKKKRTSTSKRRSPRKKVSRARRGRFRRTPHTAGKRRDRSTKRIRYTKNGQPYVIMRSGKARFISKRGAKSARKRKGGRY